MVSLSPKLNCLQPRGCEFSLGTNIGLFAHWTAGSRSKLGWSIVFTNRDARSSCCWTEALLQLKYVIYISERNSANVQPIQLWVQALSSRDERDFGLETETETRMVSVLVSSFETKSIKSRSQSQNLRLISKVSVSVSDFETRIQKSRSQSQNT